MELFCANCTCRWCVRLRPALESPANRRILLAEVQSEGLTGWGECTAGEHPFFSSESTDTAWQVLVNELGPMLAAPNPRAWRRLPEDLQAGARQPHGQGHA